MLFKSQVYTEASGSIGGITYSRNRGGMYTRARAMPTNPNTPYQQAIRAAVALLTSRWLDALTDLERLAWDDYALYTPLLNRLGEPHNVGGLAMFVRSNVPRIQAGIVIQNSAPYVNNLGEMTAPTAGAISAGGGTIAVNYSDGDAWVEEDGAHLLIYVSRGMNASINFFKGPFRYAGMVDGDAVTPPVPPASITLPFAVTAGQRVVARAAVTRADGRRSADATFRGTAVV